MVDVKFRLLKPNQKEEVPHKLSNLTDSQIAEREQRVKQMCKENKNKKYLLFWGIFFKLC